MKFAFNDWNLGGKIIFISACLALISMFMPWVDVIMAGQSGFSGFYFLLLGFFVYPVLMLLQNQYINMQIGYGCAGLSFLITIYIIYKISNAAYGLVNVTGTGAYLFLITSIALGAAIYLYFNNPSDGYNRIDNYGNDDGSYQEYNDWDSSG